MKVYKMCTRCVQDKMKVKDYKKLLNDNITNIYRKTDPKTVQKINVEAKLIAPN